MDNKENILKSQDLNTVAGGGPLASFSLLREDFANLEKDYKNGNISLDAFQKGKKEIEKDWQKLIDLGFKDDSNEKGLFDTPKA